MIIFANKNILFIRRNDSIVTEKINYDLLKKMKGIQDGEKCTELLGYFTQSKTSESIPSAIVKHNMPNTSGGACCD